MGKAITLDDGIDDKVSVRFEDLHYVQAVDEVADLTRCVARRSGDSIVVSKPPRVTMEFRRAELVEVIHLIAEEADANFPLPTLGRLDYDKSRNHIVVLDTKAVLDDIEQVIRAIDVEPVQVLLDVTSVKTSNEDLIQMCANWSSRNDCGITIGHGPSDPNSDGACQTSGRFPFNIGSAPSGSAPGAGVPAFLTGNDMAATLRLFAQDADTEFIMRPNLAIRHEAGTGISIGYSIGEEIHDTGTLRDRQIHGADGAGSQPQGSPPPPGVLQITMGERRGDASNAAVWLSFVPHLVVGTDKFILTVIPPDETLMGSASQAGGLEESNDPSSVAITGTSARKRPATIVTHVLIESGQTVVLAWPHPEGARPTPRRFPFVRETSVLGQMFRRLAEKSAKTRHFIFVSPHAVRDPVSPR